jgi:predicted amidohydrolase
MRVLLAALNAPKGEVAGNLERHVAVLEQARAEGCELAVFPELSLTGSVDPASHPERAMPVDAEPVRALAAATGRTGAAAVFGIAERAGAAFHITQVYAHGGRRRGVYRKRHLGEGEEAYQVGAGGGVFRLGAVRFGVALFAEGGVDFPWTEAAGGGASLVCFCSAPGLYGRRTDRRAGATGMPGGWSRGSATRSGTPGGWGCGWRWPPRRGRRRTRTSRGWPRWCRRPARSPGCRTGDPAP